MLRIHISKGTNIFVADKFMYLLIDKYERYLVYTDDGTWSMYTIGLVYRLSINVTIKQRIHSK